MVLHRAASLPNGCQAGQSKLLSRAIGSQSCEIRHQVLERRLDRGNIVAEHGEGFHREQARVCCELAQVLIDSLPPKNLTERKIRSLVRRIHRAIHHGHWMREVNRGL